MTASERDSTLLDNERRKNDELLAENARLRDEIARLNWKSAKLRLDIHDLMEK